MKRLLLTIGLILSTIAMYATDFVVNSQQDLKDALINVKAGDEIIITAGETIQYTNGAINSACFYSGVDGTASTPITIRSSVPGQKATIRGGQVTSKAVMIIEGNYWIFRDITITNGKKGLVFDNSNYSKVFDCEFHHTGNEALHVRDGSDHTLIENCKFYDTGVDRGQFGEALYIGSDRGAWGTYDKDVDFTTVRGCTIGPDVRAEHFDIKEGTTETIVENCIMDGKGISLDAYEDSFIDLKGVRTIIRNNTFNRNGEENVKRAIAVVDRERELSSYDHVIHGNTFNMDNTTTPIILVGKRNQGDYHAFNNIRNPSGTLYQYDTNDNGSEVSRITETCPSFYNQCGPQVDVTGVSITPSPVTINVSSSTTLTATIAPYNASDKAVTWSSNNEGVASITAGGIVTGLSEGTATITVRTNDGNKSDNVSVTVQKVTTIAKGFVLKHGRLRVSGNHVVDKNGELTSLAGMSMFWSGYEYEGGKFYEKETVDHISEDWNASIVRAAMAVEQADGGSGYIADPQGEQEKVIKVIDAAIDNGIYGIIDFHTHEAQDYESEAITFFTAMAERYGDTDNVIYEVFNEPIGGYDRVDRVDLWNNTIKPYAEAVIAAIRSVDPDNLIIVGTPYFDQGVDVASENPIDDDNVAYALHFYAGAVYEGNENTDHTSGGRAKATTAINNGIALFVTEWGTVNSDGNGAVAIDQTEDWLTFMRENGISHANWAISDKAEGSAAVEVGGGIEALVNNQLTESGDYVRNMIKDWTEEVDIVNVNSVSLSPSSVTLDPTETELLSATINPSNATNQSLTWESSNPAVATVNSSGLITAVAEGSATITVTTVDGNRTDNVSVTVNDAPPSGDITIESVDAEQLPNVAENLLDGDTDDASRWSANGFPNSVVIDYGENKSITGTKLWTYQNRAYQYTIEASTSPSSGFSQIVNRSNNTSTGQPIANSFDAVTARYIKITVTGASGYNSTWVSLTEFEIVEGSGGGSDVSVTGVSLSPNSNTLNEGQTMQLTAAVSPSNATNQSVSYSSNNTSIATVNSAGLVNAINAGSTTIIVTTNDGGFTATSNITVNGAGGGSTTCSFGAPSSSALIGYDDVTFTEVHILGSGGPTLSNLTKFRINWIPSDNNLKRFAINTNDGSPSYYNDLRTSMNYDFNSSSPDLSISSSGFEGLDGDYWVTNDGDNFVMVSKNGGFTLYFSNNSAAPSCSNARLAQNVSSFEAAQFAVYPNPSTSGQFKLSSEKDWSVYSIHGGTIMHGTGKDINMSAMPKGIYFLHAEGLTKKLIIK